MLARGLVSEDWSQASEQTDVHGMLYPALWTLVILIGGTPWAMCFLCRRSSAQPHACYCNAPPCA